MSAATPKPALRVGITGTRALAERAVPPLQTAIGALLDHIATHRPAPSALHALSPLAEGSDRLLAEAALARGWHLIAPIPFLPEDYETDFPATSDHFRSLLARATPIVLEGTRADADAAYEAAGHVVVHNCDLLITVWDGHTSNGRGGTAEIARYAASQGVPIWWLIPDGTTPPRLVRTQEALTDPTQAPSGPSAFAALTSFLDRRR